MVGAGLGASANRLLSDLCGREEEQGAGPLSQSPVIPVPGIPSVEASELQVSEDELTNFLSFQLKR